MKAGLQIHDQEARATRVSWSVTREEIRRPPACDDGRDSVLPGKRPHKTRVFCRRGVGHRLFPEKSGFPTTVVVNRPGEGSGPSGVPARTPKGTPQALPRRSRDAVPTPTPSTTPPASSQRGLPDRSRSRRQSRPGGRACRCHRGHRRRRPGRPAGERSHGGCR